jgi:glutathione S-transferase
MKLYYAPGACSLSPHIVAREAGIGLDLEQVDNREKKTKNGQDFGGSIQRAKCRFWRSTAATG